MLKMRQKIKNFRENKFSIWFLPQSSSWTQSCQSMRSSLDIFFGLNWFKFGWSDILMIVWIVDILWIYFFSGPFGRLISTLSNVISFQNRGPLTKSIRIQCRASSISTKPFLFLTKYLKTIFQLISGWLSTPGPQFHDIIGGNVRSRRRRRRIRS